jgi:AcrR family transcriptional regulator
LIVHYQFWYASAVTAITPGPASLRVDAARNVERIVDAAQVVFSASGRGASMDDVAAAAGVGVATVYRRFPTKRDLLRAVLERRWDELIDSGLRIAEQEADPREALRLALESAVLFMTSDPVMVSAAADLGLMTMDLARRFCDPVAEILRRGQRDGSFRTDLVQDDIPRLVLMLFGTLPSFPPGSDGWRRYLDLMLDSLAAEATELAPPTPVHDHHPVPATWSVR